jgi:hypothetical protein
MISPGFKFGYYYGVVLGGTLGVDYALGIGFPLTVGAEIGFIKPIEPPPMWAMPVLVRAAYHPDLGISNLDFYVMAKAGISLSFLTGDFIGLEKNVIGFSYGGNVGCRYFVNDTTAMFLEGGYDYYPMNIWHSNAFVTAGLTFKF